MLKKNGKWGLFISTSTELESCPQNPTICVFNTKDDAESAALEIVTEEGWLRRCDETDDLIDEAGNHYVEDALAIEAIQDSLGASEYLHVYECCEIET